MAEIIIAETGVPAYIKDWLLGMGWPVVDTLHWEHEILPDGAEDGWRKYKYGTHQTITARKGKEARLQRFVSVDGTYQPQGEMRAWTD